MRAFKHLHALAVISWGLGALCCAEHDLTHDPSGEGARDSASCRRFQGAANVRVGDAAGELSCRFEPSSGQHTCRLYAGDLTLSTSQDYASTADFIEAGHHLGKQTSLRETRTENGVARVTTHHYDELGRLVRSREVRAGTGIVHAYSDYDDVGRPRRATSRTEARGECGDEVVRIEYSDRDRTVLRRFQPVDAARCGFTTRSQIERYDGSGNRVSVDEADGSGVATLFEARRGANLKQICL